MTWMRCLILENKEKNFVSAVVYVHDAENRIGRFLQTIVEVLDQNFEHSEILCVNDGSGDNSLEIIRQVASRARETGITVINMSCFHGREIAMKAGMDLSIGDFVFEFDNTVPDFAPETVMEIYRKSLEGYDIVNAAPLRKERLTSRLFYTVFNRFSGGRFDLKTESFRILSRRAINRISSMNKTVPYRKVIYADAGFKMETISYAPEDCGVQAVDREDRQYRVDLATDCLLLFSKVGYKLSMVMTMAMMGLSIFMILYSTVTYLTANPIAGWTTTILFLSFAFFGLFGILTIIIKYLQLLLNLVFKRKYYTFESIEKLTK